MNIDKRNIILYFNTFNGFFSDATSFTMVLTRDTSIILLINIRKNIKLGIKFNSYFTNNNEYKKKDVANKEITRIILSCLILK